MGKGGDGRGEDGRDGGRKEECYSNPITLSFIPLFFLSATSPWLVPQPPSSCHPVFLLPPSSVLTSALPAAAARLHAARCRPRFCRHLGRRRPRLPLPLPPTSPPASVTREAMTRRCALTSAPRSHCCRASHKQIDSARPMRREKLAYAQDARERVFVASGCIADDRAFAPVWCVARPLSPMPANISIPLVATARTLAVVRPHSP